MTLILLPYAFDVCQIKSLESVDFSREFVFLAKTDEELSLVCETALAPPDCVKREPGWRAFKIEGVLDFSMVGVLAEISGLLARAGISIFAVSTYNTDYIFVKDNKLEKALDALENGGFSLTFKGTAI